MSLMGVSNKTVVIVNNGGPAPRERKRPKTSLFLSAKVDTPFRGQGGCVLGKIWKKSGLRCWGGLSSHAEGIIFQKTIVWTVNDQEKRRTLTVTTDNHDKMKKCDGAVLPISLVWVL